MEGRRRAVCLRRRAAFASEFKTAHYRQRQRPRRRRTRRRRVDGERGDRLSDRPSGIAFATKLSENVRRRRRGAATA